MKRCQFQVLMLVLLVVHEGFGVPALDSSASAATPNTIEESDKLPEGSGEAATHDAALASTKEKVIQEPESSEASTPDNVASGSSIDPTTIYAGGVLTPELLQQYLTQYGAYAPFMGAYPAPVGAASPGIYPYPGPIVVQTGYEGFLVPANAVGQSDSTTVVAPTGSSSSANPLLVFASKFLPSILMSSLFRIVAVVLSTIGIILFGGSIASALCRVTPICDIPARAVNILRSGGSQDVGRMLAEEITPERVRRASVFVQNAIKKYQQLQKLVDESGVSTT
uniref:CG10035-PA n=1 Tax=Drosophila phaeopleura TaxID=195712 RepID=D1GZ14_9MUSC|nr:CG10035-PA [Drosophila phaeopleura]